MFEFIHGWFSISPQSCELIQLEAVRAVANNTEVFFGDKLPNISIDPWALGPA